MIEFVQDHELKQRKKLIMKQIIIKLLKLAFVKKEEQQV